eukprot:3759470-Rhodomonas_salina.1
MERRWSGADGAEKKELDAEKGWSKSSERKRKEKGRGKGGEDLKPELSSSAAVLRSSSASLPPLLFCSSYSSSITKQHTEAAYSSSIQKQHTLTAYSSSIQ